MKNSLSTLLKTKNGWEAQDNFDLPNDHQLQITTYKRNGILVTSALVGRVEKHEGYTSFVYAMGVGRPGDGDFYAKLRVSGARATEKSVKDQHAEVLGLMPSIMSLVDQHYQGKFDAVEA